MMTFMSDPIPIREYEQAVYVYWFGPTLPAVKIGHSNDPYKRLLQLGNDTGVPDHLASFAAIVWLDRKREKVEARAHELAADFRRSGEWFDLNAADALGYIIAAATELKIRYEVEDCAGIHAATIESKLNAAAEAAEEKRQIDKWGENWRHKDLVEKAALEAFRIAKANAEDAVDKGYAANGAAQGALHQARLQVMAAYMDSTVEYRNHNPRPAI